jgi:hypothetical protein
VPAGYLKAETLTEYVYYSDAEAEVNNWTSIKDLNPVSVTIGPNP